MPIKTYTDMLPKPGDMHSSLTAFDCFSLSRLGSDHSNAFDYSWASDSRPITKILCFWGCLVVTILWVGGAPGHSIGRNTCQLIVPLKASIARWLPGGLQAPVATPWTMLFAWNSIETLIATREGLSLSSLLLKRALNLIVDQERSGTEMATIVL